MTFRSIGSVLTLGLLLAACDSGGNAPDGDTQYFRFLHASDSTTFVAAMSDEGVLADVRNQLEKPLEERSKFIAGPIARGDGGHNEGYPWHLVEGEWRLTEVAVEVCDANPQYVSENVDYFVDEVGRYCPWSSRVLKEIEFPE